MHILVATCHSKAGLKGTYAGSAFKKMLLENALPHFYFVFTLGLAQGR